MPLTREQVRELDRRAIEEFGIPGVVLMENAGRGVVDVMVKVGAPALAGPIHIICGKGNNGGDGYVIARHLDALGIPVVIHRCCSPEEITGDAAVMYQIAEKAGLPIVPFTTAEALATVLREATWIVDALLGTGLSGTVRSPYAEIIACMNKSKKPIIAVDLPSGMDANAGSPLGCCVVAQHTVTFVDKKTGMTSDDAWLYTGEVHVEEIGVPKVLITTQADASNSPELRLSELITELSEELASDIVSYGWLMQGIENMLDNSSNRMKQLETVLHKLLSSGIVDIGNAQMADIDRVEFIAWKGSVNHRILRAINSITSSQGTDLYSTFWLCRHDNVDRYEANTDQSTYRPPAS